VKETCFDAARMGTPLEDTANLLDKMAVDGDVSRLFIQILSHGLTTEMIMMYKQYIKLKCYIYNSYQYN
jgi:hypothetical protein